MRRAMLIVPLLAAAASSAAAQDRVPQGFSLGIGIFLNPTALLTGSGGGLDDLFVPIGLGNFTIPLLVGSRARIEPELGFTRLSTSTTSPDGSFSNRGTARLLRAGLGVSLVLVEDGGFRSHTGIRFGLSRFSQDLAVTTPGGSSESSAHRMDTYVGAVLGGEYFLSRRFSLGGEFQLTRLAIGDVERSGTGPFPPPPPSQGFDSSIWSTNGLIAVRFYLF